MRPDWARRNAYTSECALVGECLVDLADDSSSLATAAATRFIDLARTSPIAKTPG